jgi:hypothetical protein
LNTSVYTRRRGSRRLGVASHRLRTWAGKWTSTTWWMRTTLPNFSGCLIRTTCTSISAATQKCPALLWIEVDAVHASGCGVKWLRGLQEEMPGVTVLPSAEEARNRDRSDRRSPIRCRRVFTKLRSV